MKAEVFITIIAAGVAVLGFIVFFSRRPKKGIDRSYFEIRWKELQKLLGKSDTWPVAIIQADNLLDEALKKSRYKGKTMGERLVSAQRTLSDNDKVWYGHKLRNQIVHEVDISLNEKDVKQALIGIRQALRDLGAL